MKIIYSSLLFTFFFLALVSNVHGTSPLRKHTQNWRYFTDDSGKTIILAGSHSWFRKEVDKHWVPNNWDIDKFNKYLDFLEYWNHNYIRLWMWEHKGDVDVWMKDSTGKYDLSKLNPKYFELVQSFVETASSRGIYCGVMLFQGWSGCNTGSIPDWPQHPMNKANNINGIDGDPAGKSNGVKVHSLDNPDILKFQKMYIDKMIETLNGYDNIIWEVGNEIAHSGRAWINHVVDYIREKERQMPNVHLVLDGLCYGGNNDAEWTTHADIYCPGALVEWSAHNEIYVINPMEPDIRLRMPIILDNDHIGNHFLRFTSLEQRSWTWKAFTRGNHILHMDNYDIFWEGESPTPDHPIKGVATNPHFDPQRKSLGDILRYSDRVDLSDMVPVTDSSFCSTTFCLKSEQEYIVYQPDTESDIFLSLDKENYIAESFDTADSSVESVKIRWKGGRKAFSKPVHAQLDWVLLITKQ